MCVRIHLSLRRQGHPSLTLPIVKALQMAVALVGPEGPMLCAKQVNADIVSWA